MSPRKPSNVGSNPARSIAPYCQGAGDPHPSPPVSRPTVDVRSASIQPARVTAVGLIGRWEGFNESTQGGVYVG